MDNNTIEGRFFFLHLPSNSDSLENFPGPSANKQANRQTNKISAKSGFTELAENYEVYRMHVLG